MLKDRQTEESHEGAHEWAITSRSIALTTPRWRVEASDRTRVSSDLGEELPHRFFRVLDEDFVHVIALTDDRKIVLVREFHHGVERAMLTLPGGGRSAGESFADAARRELLEETGFASDDPLQSLGEFWPSPKRQNNRGEAFVARGVQQVAEIRPDDTEDIAVEMVAVDAIADLIRSGELAGGFSMACLLMWLLGERSLSWPA